MFFEEQTETMADWDDDDGSRRGGYNDRLPTQHELLDVEIARWADAEREAMRRAAAARAHADHLRGLRAEVALRPLATVTRLPERHAPAGVHAPAAVERRAGHGVSVVAAAERSTTHAVSVVAGETASPIRRSPTLDELVHSGALAAGRDWGWEHRHQAVRGGGFNAGIHVFRYAGAGVDVTPIYPSRPMIFATEAESRAFNVELARWHFTDVTGGSPCAPLGVSDTGA